MTTVTPSLSTYVTLITELRDALRATGLFESVQIEQRAVSMPRVPACLVIPCAPTFERHSTGLAFINYPVELILGIRSGDPDGDTTLLLDLQAAVEKELTGTVFAQGTTGHFDTVVVSAGSLLPAKGESFVKTGTVKLAMIVTQER